MSKPSIIPADEPKRLAAVRRYDILDTPPDGAFDRVTAIAARRFGVPISIVSIVDHDRIWFKSHHGLDVKQIGRDPGLCASAILSEDPWLLPDAKTDIRSLANPLVAGEFGLRFYAGVPLRTHDGFNLGTLCVIDKEPRPIDRAQIEDLKDLASVQNRSTRPHALLSAGRRAGRSTPRHDSCVCAGMLSCAALRATRSGEPFSIAATRVGAVARVHRHFYLDKPSETVGCLTCP